jgi:hypothetical protein
MRPLRPLGTALTAYHEAGHAVLLLALGGEPGSVSIIESSTGRRPVSWLRSRVP